MSVCLNGLATAVPPNVLPQEQVLERARRILGPRYQQFDRMVSTFETAGVATRHSVVPIEWFETPRGWVERNAAYLEGASALFIEAARAALADAALEAGQIDTIVTVSSTGIATPTLEARVWREMGFRSDVRRLPVFGLGCAGGVTGLEIARAQAQARPGSRVLLVALEACTLSFRSDRLQKADIIATVLFGDGAAAACLSSAPGAGARRGIRMGPGHEHLWHDTLQIMGWDVDATGLGVVFDRSIPSFAARHMAEVADAVLARAGLARGGIDRFVCHPGGTKVVIALEHAYGLVPGSLDAERAVLRDHGNMSAPTVLFVLERVLGAGTRGQMLLSALGPGFTASFLPLEVGADG